MRLFLTRFLVLSSFLLLQNCSIPKAVKPLKRGQKKEISIQDFSPPFQDNFKSLVFKTNLSYSDKFDLGGLLVIKQLSEGNYRTIFLAMSGSTLFDFEFGENGFIVHQSLKIFDKKILLQIIEQDFSLLLAKDVLGHQGQVFEQSKGAVITSKNYPQTYFLTAAPSRKAQKVFKAKKVTVSFLEYQKGVPKNIVIQHHHLPLKMRLRLIRS